jgi:prepilin-type N-terminal cleavage/methylation domain-containing protein
MFALARPKHRAFSLIELVIVVVILGIIAAIAVPRMSRGASGAADSSLTANLTVLRNAIDLFQAEHQGMFPSESSIADQLTKYTDINGNVSATKTGEFIYGPYLRSVPALPVGEKKGATGIAKTDGPGVGWIYDAATGTIRANATGNDARGVPYSSY